MTSYENIMTFRKTCFSKWKSTIRDLDLEVEESFIPDLSIVLENQNSYVSDSEDKVIENAVEVVAKIHAKSIIRNIVSFQPMIDLNGKIFYTDFHTHHSPDAKLIKELNSSSSTPLAIFEHSIIVKTRKLNQYPSELSLDEIATNIANEITREVTRDLVNNSGTYESFEYEKNGLYVELVKLKDIVYRKTLKGRPNWIYTSKILGEELLKEICVPIKESSEEIFKIGSFYDTDVYVDTKFENTILMGFRGRGSDISSNYNAGYVYSPYISLMTTPIISEADKADFNPLSGYMTKYSKKLFRTGAKYYAKLKVNSI